MADLCPRPSTRTNENGDLYIERYEMRMESRPSVYTKTAIRVASAWKLLYCVVNLNGTGYFP